jgi:hypothetical protein
LRLSSRRRALSAGSAAAARAAAIISAKSRSMASLTPGWRTLTATTVPAGGEWRAGRSCHAHKPQLWQLRRQLDPVKQDVRQAGPLPASCQAQGPLHIDSTKHHGGTEGSRPAALSRTRLHAGEAGAGGRQRRAVDLADGAGRHRLRLKGGEEVGHAKAKGGAHGGLGEGQRMGGGLRGREVTRRLPEGAGKGGRRQRSGQGEEQGGCKGQQLGGWRGGGGVK